MKPYFLVSPQPKEVKFETRIPMAGVPTAPWFQPCSPTSWSRTYSKGRLNGLPAARAMREGSLQCQAQRPMEGTPSVDLQLQYF